MTYRVFSTEIAVDGTWLGETTQTCRESASDTLRAVYIATTRRARRAPENAKVEIRVTMDIEDIYEPQLRSYLQQVEKLFGITIAVEKKPNSFNPHEETIYMTLRGDWRVTHAWWWAVLLLRNAHVMHQDLSLNAFMQYLGDNGYESYTRAWGDIQRLRQRSVAKMIMYGQGPDDLWENYKPLDWDYDS